MQTGLLIYNIAIIFFFTMGCRAMEATEDAALAIQTARLLNKKNPTKNKIRENQLEYANNFIEKLNHQTKNQTSLTQEGSSTDIQISCILFPSFQIHAEFEKIMKKLRMDKQQVPEIYNYIVANSLKKYFLTEKQIELDQASYFAQILCCTAYSYVNIGITPLNKQKKEDKDTQVIVFPSSLGTNKPEIIPLENQNIVQEKLKELNNIDLLHQLYPEIFNRSPIEEQYTPKKCCFIS